MRYIISRVDVKNKCFYTQVGIKEEGFYLSSRLAKLFLPYLSEGTVVGFSIMPKMRKHLKRLMYQINAFEFIAQTNPYVVVYDFKRLRNEMFKTLSSFDNLLFLDCEMTMKNFHPNENFVQQVIQVGYVLADKKGEVIKLDSYYVKPLKPKDLNKRTCKFLSLDKEKFFQEAKDFEYFYQDLLTIYNEYKPKIVVWGKNDLIAIMKGFVINEKSAFLSESDFVDLLKLHKDFFNLRNDLGLFKAYQIYYLQPTEKQAHDAKIDAIITKDIYDAFLLNIKTLV